MLEQKMKQEKWKVDSPLGRKWIPLDRLNEGTCGCYIFVGLWRLWLSHSSYHTTICLCVLELLHNIVILLSSNVQRACNMLQTICLLPNLYVLADQTRCHGGPVCVPQQFPGQWRSGWCRDQEAWTPECQQVWVAEEAGRFCQDVAQSLVCSARGSAMLLQRRGGNQTSGKAAGTLKHYCQSNRFHWFIFTGFIVLFWQKWPVCKSNRNLHNRTHIMIIIHPSII